MYTVKISASREYGVHIGHGLLNSFATDLTDIKPLCRVLVVTDKHVDEYYSQQVLRALELAGYRADKYVVPPGEGSKSMARFGNLLQALARARYTRTDLLIALGGGVVGDLTGFAASVYQRGIDFVQLPTTLLAAVDSSVGGKTAINLPQGKNMVGSFYQPIGVWCDTDTFDTLPPQVFADGLAEVIKYGILRDKELFEALKCGKIGNVEAVVERCVKIKKEIVQQDERDTGNRALLNLGHTFGHAIEKASNFTVSHGRAVGMGLAMAARAACRMGLCALQVDRQVEQVLALYGLSSCCNYPPEKLWPLAVGDKKREGDTIKLVLPTDIGHCVLHPVTTGELYTVFKAGGEPL